METNWAGNYAYRARRIVTPASVAELQEIVAAEPRVRALGSRHSFTDLPDSEGALLSLSRLPVDIDVDHRQARVAVGAGVSYGVLAAALHEEGWALASMASLPHISVGGAVSTGTHGSGDRVGSLAAAVRALEIVGPTGDLRWVERGDPDFDGSVVALGALGVITRLVLDVEPTFVMRQDIYTDLPWEAVFGHFDDLTASADSVSLFTDWVGDQVDQVWLKSRDISPPRNLFGALPAGGPLHMLRGAPTEAVTEQGGVLGPWFERLPHFRLAFTPSRGAELQSEYLLPRDHATDAFAELRRLGRGFAHVLQVSEIRTVAPDSLWLSGSYEQDTVAVHFTWERDPEAVFAVLPEIEKVLLPLGGRPHWGKCFAVTGEKLTGLYPRLDDFQRLRTRIDPDGTFDNAYLARVLGPVHDTTRTRTERPGSDTTL